MIDRPITNTLVIVVIVVAVGWLLHLRTTWATRPRLSDAVGNAKPEPIAGSGLEPPAVVALLTNGYDVPRSAVTATAIDLATRGWVTLTTVDQELVVVTRGNGAVGDSLQPFEQQVMNHLTARAFNDLASASTVASSHHRLNRRWWLRFSRSVAKVAHDGGLSIRRYTALEIAPSAAAATVGLIGSWLAVSGGTEIAIADSWQSRGVWLVAVAAAIGLIWSTALRAIGSAQRPTELGTTRTARWMGYRQRLSDRIPAHASVLAPPAQQSALAHACVMGVAEHVLDEFPAAPEDHRRAWSEAGDVPRVVRVRYPIRPGYGQHPLKVGATGVGLFFVSRWLREFFGRIADGEALESLLERAPGQIDLIERLAEILSVVFWLPIAWSVWAVIAGATDMVATRERTGVVVRARRPPEVVPPLLGSVVKPFADRGSFATYLAVDNGKRSSVTAWLANERTAAPQGAQARVRATPLLGYVRSSEPVGTAARPT
jgi:hypothetical protein